MSSDFNVFIDQFKERLNNLFHVENNIDELSIERGLPKSIWNDIMEARPLSVAIPTAFGGRGIKSKECLSLLSTTSYESLPLSLTFGINIGLFLEPLAKYGHSDIQEPIFKKFLKEKAMGGLMLTEPDFGTDALNMRTHFKELAEGFRLKGQKHWQGLTGMADYWIVAARNKLKNNELSRDLSFFVTDNSEPKQKIKVDKYFNNLGLYMIPYGLNKIDISVPKNQQLQKKSTGIKMMLDILHRSRVQFPGMGMGFIRRMMDEAMDHCTHRKVAGKMLSELDSVRFQLSRIQSFYTLCSGMCARSASISDIKYDLSTKGLEANIMKAFVTDLMQESAQICMQLSGSSGYKLNHIAGRGIVDSRPFQIFEGSNEMLYTQIAEMTIKQMKKVKIPNLYNYLAQTDTCNLIIKEFQSDLNFEPGSGLAQRKLIVLGKIIARLISLQYTYNIVEKGYRKDLYDNCVKHIKREVKGLLSDYSAFNNAEPIMDYKEQSDWLNFV